MDRGAWWASPWGCKGSDTTEVTSHSAPQVRAQSLQVSGTNVEFAQ